MNNRPTIDAIINYFSSHSTPTKETVKALLTGSKNQITERHNDKNKIYFKDQLCSHIYYANEDGMETTTANRYRSKIDFDELLNGDVDTIDSEYRSFYFLSSLCTLIPCRHYFDIDHLTQALTIQEINDVLEEFYKPFNINISTFGVALCEKRVKDHVEFGYHIVVPTLCSSIDDLKEYVRYFNIAALSNIKFDESVYNGGRIFRLPYSTDNIKPDPYIIIQGTFKDWDLANTDNVEFIKLCDIISAELSTTSSFSKRNDFKTHSSNKSLFYDRLTSKYNFDMCTVEQKITFFNECIQYITTNRTNSPNSKYIEFWVHNNRSTHYDDINCPEEHRDDLVMSKYLLSQQLYYTIARSHFVFYGCTYNQRKLQSLINNDYKQCCQMFDRCLTPKALSTGNLYDNVSKIDFNKACDDRRLYKMLIKYAPDIGHDFLYNINNMRIRAISNKLHPFIIETYTMDDYMYNKDRFTTINQHLTALMKAIAYVVNSNQYVIKVKSPADGRVMYKLHGLSYFQRDYNIPAIFKIDNRQLHNKVVKNKDEIDLVLCDDDDTQMTDNTDSSSSSRSSTAREPLIKYKEKRLHDLIVMLLNENLMLKFAYAKPFGDILYDIDDDDTTIPIDSVTKQTQSSEPKTNILEQLIGRPVAKVQQHSTNDSERLPILSLYTPPISANLDIKYNKHLVQDWLSFMMSRIKTKYHQAFIDLLYSIRYRLISSGATPAKCYILHGKHGNEGKSFLLACLAKVFGDASINLSRNQFLNEKFDAWKIGKGLIAIEECEGNSYTQLQLTTQIKNYTTKDTTSRDMCKINQKDTNYAVLCMTTNDEQLNGLIRADEATISRLVVIKFNKLNFASEYWSEIVMQFINESDAFVMQTFTYSLWRYLISSSGFISNEGKSYNYTTDRYNGVEKKEFIDKAKLKANTLANQFISKLRYKDEKYNALATWLVNKSGSEDTYEILEHSLEDNKTYISTKVLQIYLNDFINKLPSKTSLTFKDIEEQLVKDGWEHGSPIKLAVGDRIYGYFKIIRDEDMLHEIKYNVYESDEDNTDDEIRDIKNKTIDSIRTVITEQLVQTYNKHTYITVKSINELLKQHKHVITKSDIEDILYRLSYNTKPYNLRVNGATIYVYKHQ